MCVSILEDQRWALQVFLLNLTFWALVLNDEVHLQMKVNLGVISICRQDETGHISRTHPGLRAFLRAIDALTLHESKARCCQIEMHTLFVAPHLSGPNITT